MQVVLKSHGPSSTWFLGYKPVVSYVIHTSPSSIFCNHWEIITWYEMTIWPCSWLISMWHMVELFTLHERVNKTRLCVTWRLIETMMVWDHLIISHTHQIWVWWWLQNKEKENRKTNLCFIWWLFLVNGEQKELQGYKLTTSKKGFL